MTSLVDVHPCFRCVLPDCDDRSKRCVLRLTYNAHSNRHRKGIAETSRQKAIRNEAYKELYGDRNRQRNGNCRDVVSEVGG